MNWLRQLYAKLRWRWPAALVGGKPDEEFWTRVREGEFG